MKCIPGVSSRAGFECQVCRRSMGQDDSRQCPGSPVTIAASEASEASCCPGTVEIKPCIPVKIQDCQDAGYERCVRCGYLFVPGASRTRACTNPDSQRQPYPLPSMLATGAKYIQAYAKFRAAGQPMLDLPQIIERFRICSACDKYTDSSSRCGICGCFVNLLHGGQGMNKLEWATEQCPDSPAKWDKLA